MKDPEPKAEAPASRDKAAKPKNTLTVVGIGASAGGLEALTELLQYLPPNENMAFVVIQHLDPHYESALAELLSNQTVMPVVQVHSDVPLERGRLYVIAPNTLLLVSDGILTIEKRPLNAFKPIDSFFHALAEQFRERAIGVVLSGTATDGTLGLKHIKAEGGITFAQDRTAKFDSMPRSAISAGAVDFILSPRQIAEELTAISRRNESSQDAKGPLLTDGPAFERVLLLLRRHTGIDFAQYKRPIVFRRLNRRMVVRETETCDEYLQFLQKEPEELDALFDDLLINVTDFFRDPDVFESARRLALPSVVQNRKQPHTIRAWIPGCSSGEEVYSMAIALTEFLESQDLSSTIQLFGTDVSERMIEVARKGLYNESAVLNVSPDRLRRFFLQTDLGYQVTRQIRDMCIFSRHNVAKDPPLSRMDVISCRNLLIYFTPSLQQRVIGTFSSALQPSGCLILGTSETVGSLAEHFTVLDESRKIYCRRATSAPLPLDMPDEQSDVVLPERAFRSPEAVSVVPVRGSGLIQRYADRIVLSRYGPAGLVIDEMLRVLSYRGDVSEYLQPSVSEQDANLMAIVRADLRAVLSAALEKARRTDVAVVADIPPLNAADKGRPVAITVVPLALAGNPKHFLVLFGRNAELTTLKASPEPEGEVPTQGSRISIEDENANLQQELASTREYLQSVIEELRSTNEEVQSANEELRSTNEEMQTSKEELQSSNEELHTINAELQGRNAELGQVNNDLVNLLGSMNMPIVMTGRDLRIRRFTPTAERALRLIPTDIGRPIADLKPRINVPDLENILRQVLDTLLPYEREVEDQEGRSYLMRARPYRPSDDRIDGVVLQLLDVSEIKRSLKALKDACDYAEAIVNTTREPLVVLDEQMTIRDGNRAFCQAMDISSSAAKGKAIFEVAHGRFDTPAIRALFDQLKVGTTELNDVEIEPKPGSNGARTLLVNARRLQSPDRESLILVAFEDITERKRAAEVRYRRIFESARDGIVILDALSGEILDVNPFAEQLLASGRQELAGRKLWEIESIGTAYDVRGALEQTRERGLLRFDEFQVRTREDRGIQVEVIAILYSEGERQAIQLNMRDVSERKKFERELQETQKLESLGLLAGGIAHDFNNLLTGILGNASLALSETSPDQPIRSTLRPIIEAAERAAFLTRQMLAYAGRDQFVTARIDLSDAVREIAALVRTSIPKAVDLRLDLARNLPAIETDPAQVQQIVMNLVINGAEAIDESVGGAVTVRTAVRAISAHEAAELFTPEPASGGTYVVLEVTDTGAGMDDSTKARIFDPFFTTKFTGRGLGLAAVRGIVKRHHGAIVVRSSPGRGTTFRIFLPASEQLSAVPAQQAPAQALPAGSDVLVIDDEHTIRQIAERVLTRQGVKVLTADNGRSGVQKFREHSREISAVVLDLQMPVMGGEEALALLHEINPNVPVVLSSGFDESEASRRFSVQKPAGFLQKPYTAERLLRALGAVVKKPKE
jgi:two-component system, chemotaxis family, CheB/CheR fusion protein